MRKSRKNAIEVPMGYPSVDPSMAWSTDGGAEPFAPSPYSDQVYAPDPAFYAEQTTLYTEASPYGDPSPYGAGPYPDPSFADAAAYPAGYGADVAFADPAYGADATYADQAYAADPTYGGQPPYPPASPMPPASDDEGSQHRGIKIAVAIVAVIAVIILVIVGTNVYTVTSTRDDVHRVSAFYQQETDAVVVLGASVFADGTPSDILADRLEVAADLYKAGAAREVIVSGDNTDAHYNESEAMRDYLVDLGVPEEKIIVDRLGTDTYASMYRAKYAYGCNRIIVVTQAYHLYRALMIAQGLGMEAGGVPADKGDYDGQAEYSLREVLARTKDCLQTLVRVPVSTATAQAD